MTLSASVVSPPHFIPKKYIFLQYSFFPSEKRYRSWDGYGREMSGSRSVFRHGTLRWTCAPRSKWALCLPQCIPNRSDKVPPLCDPDPLLIMDRLQNRPLGGRTGSTHSSKERCSSLMNTHDRTCQPSWSVTASNRLGATCEVCLPLWLLFGPRIVLSPDTVISLVTATAYSL